MRRVLCPVLEEGMTDRLVVMSMLCCNRLQRLRGVVDCDLHMRLELCNVFAACDRWLMVWRVVRAICCFA